MPRRPHIPAALAALAISLSAALAAPPDPVRVIDGDTLVLCPAGAADESTCERVRLIDIDAPERTRPRCVGELMAAEAARIRLGELVAGGLALDRARNRDRYGRTLALVLVQDPENPARVISAGAVLVREGLARVWSARPPEGREPAPWCIPVPAARPAILPAAGQGGE